MTDVCIISAKRTPFGRFLGALSRLSAVDLAVHAGEAALEGLPRNAIDQVIVGNVLSAGLGMNIARQIGVRLQLPMSTPAYSVNMMCGSGMQAVILAMQAIQSGAANVVLCGGTESMSNAPHILPRSRTGTKFGDGKLVDTILCDGLLDAFDGQHMANTAERLATRYSISRQQQDEYAALSQQRCAEAANHEVFADELAPLEGLQCDEHPRPETSVRELAALKPAFTTDGTITAGNASGINDGACMLVLASCEAASSNGWRIMADIHAAEVVGCDPAEMGLGPVHAIRELCRKHSMTLEHFDTIEINEAFAAQTLACISELGLTTEQVNQCGGAIALGHPIGASGARLVTHLAHRISTLKKSTCLASLCIGGGMGAAIALDPIY
jgi:acetyl-CoA C-acetyltransferase